jgi:hypothetical protein
MYQPGNRSLHNPATVDPETAGLRKVTGPSREAFETLKGDEDYRDMPRSVGTNLIARPTPFARWLTYHRVRFGYSGRELARLMGWTQTVITRLETGQSTPTVEDLEALNDFFYALGGECY